MLALSPSSGTGACMVLHQGGWHGQLSRRWSGRRLSCVRCHMDIPIAATSKDPMHKKFVFALCVHQVSTPQCLATLLQDICPGSRAPFALFDHLLKKSWAPHLAYERFPDLYQGSNLRSLIRRGAASPLRPQRVCQQQGLPGSPGGHSKEVHYLCQARSSGGDL